MKCINKMTKRRIVKATSIQSEREREKERKRGHNERVESSKSSDDMHLLGCEHVHPLSEAHEWGIENERSRETDHRQISPD